MSDTVIAAPVDAYGITDKGLRRDANEDHFLIARVSKAIDVQQTSLSAGAVAHGLAGAGGAYLLAVADGVGGRPEGDVASERALAAMMSYMGRAATCFQSLDANAEHELLERLEGVVQDVHAALVRDYGGITTKLPATTLTLVLLVWPRAYHVQVGDSRAYVRRDGRLQPLTRDQNLGQYMLSRGAWTDEQVAKAPASGTLSSAIGGTELTPVVGLIDLSPGDSLMICTDGLTKHVSDDQIAAALAEEEPAEATSKRLIAAALAGGGTDNVSVIVVRTKGTAR